MRTNLINARNNHQLTQIQIAKKLNISSRQYQRIESGKTLGKADMWDTLEDLLEIPQRKLRENVKTQLKYIRLKDPMKADIGQNSF